MGHPQTGKRGVAGQNFWLPFRLDAAAWGGGESSMYMRLFHIKQQDNRSGSPSRGQLEKDPEAGNLTHSLKSNDEDSARAAAETLEQLRKRSDPHGYVVAIFEANTMRSLGQSSRAMDLFTGALQADPFITGAWVDLGSTYYEDFMAAEAWACWDAARALKPDHPFIDGINDQERKLRTEHPEFF
jgi:tetratricopeptide (TPR) repeat protein